MPLIHNAQTQLTIDAFLQTRPDDTRVADRGNLWFSDAEDGRDINLGKLHHLLHPSSMQALLFDELAQHQSLRILQLQDGFVDPAAAAKFFKALFNLTKETLKVFKWTCTKPLKLDQFAKFIAALQDSNIEFDRVEIILQNGFDNSAMIWNVELAQLQTIKVKHLVLRWQLEQRSIFTTSMPNLLDYIFENPHIKQVSIVTPENHPSIDATVLMKSNYQLSEINLDMQNPKQKGAIEKLQQFAQINRLVQRAQSYLTYMYAMPSIVNDDQELAEQSVSTAETYFNNAIDACNILGDARRTAYVTFLYYIAIATDDVTYFSKAVAILTGPASPLNFVYNSNQAKYPNQISLTLLDKLRFEDLLACLTLRSDFHLPEIFKLLIKKSCQTYETKSTDEMKTVRIALALSLSDQPFTDNPELLHLLADFMGVPIGTYQDLTTLAKNHADSFAEKMKQVLTVAQKLKLPCIQEIVTQQNKAEFVERLICNDPTLRTLRINRGENDYKSRIPTLIAAVKNNTELESLSLDAQVIDGDIEDQILFCTEVIANHPSIKKLSWGTDESRRAVVPAIFTALKTNKVLRELTLYGMYCKNLTGLAELLAENTVLESLSFRFSRFGILQTERANKVVEMWDLGDGMSQLALGLKNNRGIKRFTITDNEMEAERIQVLCEHLKDNTHLQELHLPAMNGAIDSLTQLITHNKTLQSLSINGAVYGLTSINLEAFSVALQNNKTLTKLKFQISKYELLNEMAAVIRLLRVVGQMQQLTDFHLILCRTLTDAIINEIIELKAQCHHRANITIEASFTKEQSDKLAAAEKALKEKDATVVQATAVKPEPVAQAPAESTPAIQGATNSGVAYPSAPNTTFFAPVYPAVPTTAPIEGNALGTATAMERVLDV